jgi:glucuronyl esterase-like protein
MSGPRTPEWRNPSRRTFLGGVGAAALGFAALEAATAGAARAAQPGLASAQRVSAPPPAGNATAPRAYFPSDVTQIPPTASLPDLFTFFSPIASPDHSGRVRRASDWPARAAELSDLMQYYLYGYKHPTPGSGSVFRQVPVPASTVVNFTAVFDFSTFTVELPAGSYTLNSATFVVTPNTDFVATQPYTAPAGYQSWAVGDTWNTPAHASLLVVVPATTQMVIDVTDPGAAGSTTATITLDDFQVPTRGVDTDIAGPYPAVLVVGSLSAEQVTTLKNNGYGYIAMDTGSVYSDWNGTTNPHTGAYNELYPYQAGVYEFDSGALMGWAWGISRIVDAIKNDSDGANTYNLAWNQTAVTGVSRNGKAAALAGAFDDRIAITAPSDPGGGGLTGFRNRTESEMFTYNVPVGCNQIYSLNELCQRAIGNPSESAWFTSKALDFVPGKSDHSPFDLHAVAALVAPRPFILWTGEAQQAWLGSPSSVLSLQAGKELYEFIGAGDNIAWIVRDAQHANQDRDLPDLIAIMDKVFGRRETLTRRFFSSLAGANDAALDGSGVIYPEKTYPSIADMTRNPYDIENHYVPWSRPGKHTLWSEDTYLTAGLSRVLTFHTDAQQVYLTLPDGSRLMSAASRGVATFSLTAAQAQTGRYVAETKGGEGGNRAAKDHKRIELAGFPLSDALRHGLNLTSGVPDGMAVGFSSPLANWGSADDPVQMYVNGGLLTASIVDDGSHQGYIERFGVSLKLPGAPDGPWDGTVNFTFSVQNIKLQALLGFTFAVDLQLAKAQVLNFFGQPTDGFTSTLGETPSWNSRDLQNTPYSGNFHGRWPLYPNSVDDTGARPISIPNQTAFDATIAVSDASATGLTLRFSQPLNPNEFGVGLDAVSSWTTQWAADNTAVRIAYGSPLTTREDVSVIVFRAVDAAGNMIGGPVRLLG